MPKHSPSDLKLETLRQQGTLNPRPQDVTDDLFETTEFFDARDVVQVKYEMLRRVEKEGRPITEAAAVFGFSRPSFYQAQSAFEQDGLAGLVPRKRGPKEAHKLTREIVEFLQQIRQEDPSLRSADLTERVAKRFGVVVHPRTIERGLARHQKKTEEASLSSDNRNLAVRYEQLRGDVLSLGVGQPAALGLALFLRQGLTAWMRASSRCIPTTGAGTLTSPTTVQGFSLDIRFEMTNILAGMILGQQQEAL